MNYARLRVFDAVIRHGTFAAAADALSFTPSAVSQQMARLESETGVTLLMRSPRGVEPTPAGRLLHERASRIIDEVEAAHADLDDLDALRRGSIRMGSFASATQSFAAEVVRRYRTRYAGIDVTIVDDEPATNLERLGERRLDLAIIFAFPDRPPGMDYSADRLVTSTDELEITPLFADPFVAVLPIGHQFASRSELRLDDLAGRPIIGGTNHPGFHQFVDAAAARGFELELSGHWTFDYQSVRALVASGGGIGLVPRMATILPFPGTTIKPFVAPEPTRIVAVARRQRSYMSAAASAMLAVLDEVAGEW